MKELSIPNKIKNDPDLFNRKKVIVLGDIAFDHSYYCKPSQKGFHAHHAGEEIFDIEPWGDDRGAVGSAYNICLLANSLKAQSFLVTVTGKDNEGKRVKEYLNERDQKARLIQLDGVRTITRIRFFIYNETSAGYELKYRMDKEPDYDLSYRKSFDTFRKKQFLDLLKSEITSSDALIINDTEKGFVSEPIVNILSDIINEENKIRKDSSRQNIVTLIDPKNNWSRFAGLPGAIIKPNLKETLKELNVSPGSFNPASKESIRQLAEMVIKQYGNSFSKYVITLGKDGAMLVSSSGDTGNDVYLVPPVQPSEDKPGLAAHCGDMFGAALSLGLTLDGEDIFSSVAFAAWAGSLQFGKQRGEKVNLHDMRDENNFQHLLKACKPIEFICTIDNK